MQEGQDISIGTCDECGSKYYLQASEMASLCPQCAHLLYGYKNCDHQFIDGRCIKCYWDGSQSAYLKKRNDTLPMNRVNVYDSYKFSYGRIVVFLESAAGKLPDGTILQDASGNRWKIQQYYRTTGSFETYQKIEEEEARNIYQYILEGINQQEKPVKDTILWLVPGP